MIIVCGKLGGNFVDSFEVFVDGINFWKLCVDVECGNKLV